MKEVAEGVHLLPGFGNCTLVIGETGGGGDVARNVLSSVAVLEKHRGNV